MPLVQAEFEAILADATKRIEGDIEWGEDEDHSPAVVFRAEVRSDAGYPLFVSGSYNSLAQTLSFALIHRAVGRIFALDMGKDHHNPTCENVGETHKHRWREAVRDKEAYVPDDIEAPVNQPVTVWQQFCNEARIEHRGVLALPPHIQDMLL